MLTYPAFAKAQLIAHSDMVQIPFITDAQFALGRMIGHGEYSDIHRALRVSEKYKEADASTEPSTLTT
jgi:hypothetical protein